MTDIVQNTNNIPEIQSPFEQLREVDADGKEWWNSQPSTPLVRSSARRKTSKLAQFAMTW